MLTLAHFNLRTVFPRLNGKYETVLQSEHFHLQRVENEHNVYFLISDNEGNSLGGGCVEKREGDERIRGSAYTTMGRAMSTVLATLPDVETRLARLAELVEMVKQLTGLADYSDLRIAARVDGEGQVKLEMGKLSGNDTIAAASELWHVYPTFSEITVKSKYEDIQLELMAFWGIEKIQATVTLNRGDYVLSRKCKVGFAADYTAEIDAALMEFAAVAERIPHPPIPEENQNETME